MCFKKNTQKYAFTKKISGKLKRIIIKKIWLTIQCVFEESCVLDVNIETCNIFKYYQEKTVL